MDCDFIKKIAYSKWKIKMNIVLVAIANNLVNNFNDQKLLVFTTSGTIGYIIRAQDFIDYLNKFIFQLKTNIGWWNRFL